MLAELKEQVYRANMALETYGLVRFTWGNVSGIDRESQLVVIKPSGVPYQELSPEKMVVVNLAGEVVEGEARPSSDTPTHLVLYNNFSDIGGVVHTHSHWATIWSQSGLSIPVLGTTHADYFYGSIPCTRKLTQEEIQNQYEKETGQVIVETYEQRDPMQIPGVLVNNHGPFAWGEDAEEAVRNAVILEDIARMAYHTLSLDGHTEPISSSLLNKHYLRKHGQNAYYGQAK